MSFDDIPEDKEESYPCPNCDGEVTKKDNIWECSHCNFYKEDLTNAN